MVVPFLQQIGGEAEDREQDTQARYRDSHCASERDSHTEMCFLSGCRIEEQSGIKVDGHCILKRENQGLQPAAIYTQKKTLKKGRESRPCTDQREKERDLIGCYHTQERERTSRKRGGAWLGGMQEKPMHRQDQRARAGLHKEESKKFIFPRRLQRQKERMPCDTQSRCSRPVAQTSFVFLKSFHFFT